MVHARIRGEHAWRGVAGTPCRDHLRIRGEHLRPDDRPRAVAGIIPAYAGSTGGLPVTLDKGGGIIPAYAGSTRPRGSKTHWVLGSSPHTRGARLYRLIGRARRQDHPRIRGEHLGAAEVALPVVGIIPAYAGSTLHSKTSWCSLAGSSPHTRGARCIRRRLGARSRDHPRIRGEH